MLGSLTYNYLENKEGDAAETRDYLLEIGITILMLLINTGVFVCLFTIGMYQKAMSKAVTRRILISLQRKLFKLRGADGAKVTPNAMLAALESETQLK